jgi:TorA maturation chaperone TorD
MNTSDISVIDILQGRSTSYRMFSRLFLKPLDETDIENLSARDFIAVAQELEDTGLLAEGFNDMGRALRKRHTGTRQQLSTDYTMCFDGVTAVSGQVATPYASVFLSEKALLNQESRQEVFLLFKTEGISLKSGINLPEDHLSFELEFLAILSDRVIEAFASGDDKEAVRNLKLSQDFINEYLLSWYGLFAQRALQIVKTRFYRGLLNAVWGWLKLDLATIEGLLEEIEPTIRF